MDNLHRELALAITELRSRLDKANIGSSFRLDIEVSGRISGGDVLVSYRLGHSYGSANPTGARLSPVIDEFLRRNGWDETNAPLALESPEFYEEPEAEHQQEDAA